MGFFDKLFGRSSRQQHEEKRASGPLRPVGGALVASTPDGTVVYNYLTPHMQQFMGRCVGAIKKSGIAAKGTANFSILIGEQKQELRLDRFYEPKEDGSLIEKVVAEAKRMKK